MKVRFNKAFAKQLAKQSKKVEIALTSKLELFVADPRNTLLHNHALSGPWQGYYSINISGDIRAVFELLDKNTAYFVAIGTHSQLY